jgi:hypothetical protein
MVAGRYTWWQRNIKLGSEALSHMRVKDLRQIMWNLPPMMAGSKSLNTTSSYHDMLGTSVDECKIGFYALLNAFHT